MKTKGMLLVVPSALQLTMNYCSHSCHYCFANLNKPDRTYNERDTINTLMNYQKHKSVKAQFLRDKYPILASNLVDVFAKNNYKHFLEVYKIIRKENIPIAFQTRGGYGIDDILKTLPPSYFYISITSHDDNVIKKIEPNAPTISERINLVKKLKQLGHKIEIGINPYMKEVCNVEKILQMTRDYTQFYWLNGLHLNNNQIKKIAPKGKKELDPIIDRIKKEKSNEELQEAFNTMVEYAVIPAGYPSFAVVDRTELFSVYEKRMPLAFEFVLHIKETKKIEDLIYFEDFYNFYKNKYPQWLNKLDSGYIVSVKRDYKGLMKSYTLKEILQYHWNNWEVAESCITGKCLSLFPETEKDKNNNVILKYIQQIFVHK
jgi:DNA repair photolyase